MLLKSASLDQDGSDATRFQRDAQPTLSCGVICVCVCLSLRSEIRSLVPLVCAICISSKRREKKKGHNSQHVFLFCLSSHFYVCMCQMLLWQAQRRKKKKKKNEHVSRYSHTHTHTYTQSLSPFLFAFLSLLPVDVAIATPLDKHTHTHTNYPIYTDASFFFFFCVCSFNSSVYNMSTFKKKSIHKHTKRKTNCGCALVKPVTVAPTLRFGFFFPPSPLLRLLQLL